MDSKKIGAFIASLRKEQSLTQKELADRINVTNKAVSKWETGEGYPEITIIPALAAALGITADDLLNGEQIIAEESFEPKLDNLNISLEDNLLRANMLRFKNSRLLSIGLNILGVLLFFIVFTTAKAPKDFLKALGIQLILLSASIIFFLIQFNNIKNSIIISMEINKDNRTCLEYARYTNKSLISFIYLCIGSIVITYFGSDGWIKHWLLVYLDNFPNWPLYFYLGGVFGGIYILYMINSSLIKINGKELVNTNQG